MTKFVFLVPAYNCKDTINRTLFSMFAQSYDNWRAIIIDDGAVEALRKGKSLLPAGVKEIQGHFERGDAVAIKSRNGEEFARGLIAYSSSDAQLIIGHKTDEIEAVLGYRGRGEMIHRDDLVIV